MLSRVLMYLALAASLWLCGRIANGQPPGRRLQSCTDTAAMQASVTESIRLGREHHAAWERLRDDMVLLLAAERRTTAAMERVLRGREVRRDERATDR
jgi:hypothetical protein